MGKSSRPPSPSETVVLVDDEAAILRALTRALEAEKYTVEAFSSAADAVARVRLGGVGVVVSDITMPGMTGLALLRAIRELDADLPVVLATGLPDFASATEAIDYGAFKYLVKPVETPALLETVAKATQLYRLARVKREALSLLGASRAAGDRAGLEAMFNRALSSVWIAFQPIVHATDGSIFGYEALLRSRDPDLRGPAEVLSAAERLGALDQLGRLVRDLAAKPMNEAKDGAALFVNLHPRDLLDAHLADAASSLSRIAPRVVLEITERASLSDLDDVRNKLNGLREMGFRIAIDDLGAGYAGLTSFAVLEPHVVKLDMTLVRSVDTNPTKQKIVASMTGLCNDMGLLVVAEGVETLAERDALIALKCDLLQGYLFAKPGPPFPEPQWAGAAG